MQYVGAPIGGLDSRNILLKQKQFIIVESEVLRRVLS
jgi:hypothetical protein